MTEAKASDLDEELKRLARRLDGLDNDYIVRMAASNYKAMVHKARADMRDRYIAAAKEQDPFWKAAKKPIVFDSELR